MVFVTILVAIVLVTLMVSLNALYVAGEFSAVKARKSRIAQAAKEGNRLARMLLPILEDSHRLDNYIAASQVGITLSSIVLGIYGQQQVAPLIEPLLLYLPFLNEEAAATSVAAILILIFFTGLQFLFGELIPKSLALQFPERVAKATVLPMRWSADWILRPLIIILNGSGALLLKLMGVEYGAGHGHIHSPEEIQLLIQESYQGGLLDTRGQELLLNAFRISELTVEEIAIPRTEMAALSIETPVREALHFAVNSRYTRIPVYRGDLDQVLGFVHIKDLFRLNHSTAGEGAIDKIVRKLSFIPASAPMKEVWNTLNREENYIAIAVDEFGGTVGMVTQEDLLEELFGELQDEFDEGEEPLVSPLGNDEYMILGRTPISYLNARFGLALPEGNVHTAGGLIWKRLNRIPEVGDRVEVDGARMEVADIKKKAIKTIRLQVTGRGESLAGEA